MLLPVFKEYIQFINDNNKEKLDIVEGYYWVNNQVIKAYDKQGNLHKIYRVQVDDKLNVTIKKFKYKPFEMESWQDTVKRHIDHLTELEIQAKDLIKRKSRIFHTCSPVILTSGGKDSAITDYLVQQVMKTPRIFSNTTLGCADEYQYIKSLKNTTLIKPDIGFYQWRIRDNFVPTRFSRACCTYFKEGAMVNKLNANTSYLFFMGMRNEESPARAGYGDVWKNEKWKDRNWLAILPIREWTEEDVWLFILWKNIKFSSKYRKGYSRVGCAIACPYYSKSTWVLDKYWYPKAFKKWHRILEEDFKVNHKWIRMNCTLEEYHSCWSGGLLRAEATEEVIQEFANYKGLEYSVAEKYFNHECADCGKKVNKKDEIAMNLKLLGRNIDKYYCKKHLMEFCGIDKEQWDNYIIDFKKQGCDLF